MKELPRMIPEHLVVQFTNLGNLASLWVALISCVAVYLGIWALLRYGAKRLNLDIPGSRSSHEIPTPRGGGFVLGPVIILMMGVLSAIFRRADIGVITVGAILIWLIGVIEDTRGLSSRIRLIGQIFISIILLLALDSLGMQFMNSDLPPILTGLTWVAIVFWIVWMTNLFNFMDGINGIAGIQAIVLCVGALSWVTDGVYRAVFMSVIGGTLGFLPWNFPRAKIFLGDCGSLFFGFLFGALTIVFFGFKSSHHLLEMVLWSGPFFIDASFTLVLRFLRGENISQPHRSHLYQRMARRVGGHWPVSILYGVVGLLAASSLVFL